MQMMNFCKSWLGFSDSPHPALHSPREGLSLLVASDLQQPANVLTSPAVKPAGKPPEMLDSPGLRCCYEAGDGDGLRSCTESLGFESSDEIGAGEKPTVEIGRSRSRGRKTERTRRGREVKFPPPLPSLNRNGQMSFYLKPVRKDGRILITEVKIERQEMLRASRENGRLRLDLIRPRPQKKEEEEEEEEEEAEAAEEEQRETELRPWKFPLTVGDGFRRCHEMSGHHHLPLWNPRCVTTT